MTAGYRPYRGTSQPCRPAGSAHTARGRHADPRPTQLATQGRLDLGGLQRACFPSAVMHIETLCPRREWSSLENFSQAGGSLLEHVTVCYPGIPGQGSESDDQLVAVVP
jgi:hypothetical protein